MSGPLDFGPDRPEGEEPAREGSARPGEGPAGDPSGEGPAPDDRSRWAHRRDPDWDGAARPSGEPAVPRPPGASRYLWFVGLAFVLLMGIVFVNSFNSEGVRAPKTGGTLPPFAAPLVVSQLDGDANLALKAGEGARTAACDVHGEDVLNVCELSREGPVVVAFFADRSSECIDQLDRLDRVRQRLPTLRVAAVAIKGDRDKLRRIVQARDWDFPVGWDRDGALANAYGVAVCPQMTFARAGGRVLDSEFGELSEAEITALARRAGA